MQTYKQEIVIGSSHKGTREKRFSGHGALSIWHDGAFVENITMPPSQIYQIFCRNKPNFGMKKEKHLKGKALHDAFVRTFGKPVHTGKAVIESFSE